MRLTQIFTVLIFLFLFSFCKKTEVIPPETPTPTIEKVQPKADFTASKYFPKAGESVKFTNKSKDAKSYEWDFGDGEKSNEQSPEHLFKEKGIYKVKLISKNGDQIAFYDTVVYYGLKASFRFKFNTARWHPGNLNMASLLFFHFSLCKSPDTIKNSKFIGSASGQILGNIITMNTEVPLDDEQGKYFIRVDITNTNFCGNDPNPPPCEQFNPYYTVSIPFLNTTPVNQFYEFNRFAINYEISETYFE